MAIKQLLSRLNFGFSARTPLILQTEMSECGLACIAMVAGYYGKHIDLFTLRQRFSVSLKGLPLAGVIKTARMLDLAVRPVRLELGGIPKLRLPCILHWNFDHFVVLKKVKNDKVIIHDPAYGLRTIGLDELSRSFTGFALELWPDPGFETLPVAPRIKIQQVLGHFKGTFKAAMQVILLACTIEVFALFSPLFVQWTLDNVLPANDLDLLKLLALAFATLMLFQELLKASRSWMLLYLGTRMNVQLYANVFTHLIQLPIEYFVKRSLGDVTSRFGSIDQIQRTLTTSFLEAILDGLMSLATLTMMLIYSRQLAAISIFALTLYLIGRLIWYRPLHTATEEQLIHISKKQTHLIETIRGIRSIKLFQKQEERRSAWLTLLVNQLNADLQTQQMHIVYRTANALILGLENIAIIYAGASMVLSKEFTAGALLAYIAYKTQFGLRVTSLIDKVVDVQMLQLHSERLADIVLTPSEDFQSQDRNHLINTPEPGIEVSNLAFRYGEHEKEVFSNISFQVKPGEFVAITGPSGCGKSTLLQIILGVFVQTQGYVLLGGKDIQSIGINVLRSMVGTVMQDDELFAGSIAENIAFFDANADFSWIEQCARIAAIDDDILAMPMGYDTQIGDMGSVLSGGQKQRILLARALYKRPSILFLDEATSHLDIAKEKQVNEAISALKMTRIIVAHRPDTISYADRIISMG